MNDEIVMYLIFRADLKMSPGKIAAQAGHAVQLCIREVENITRGPGIENTNKRAWLYEWEVGSYAKIALRVVDEDALKKVCGELDKEQFLYGIVVDEGRTEIPAMTVTCIAVQPMPRSQVKHIVGALKLL